MVVAALLEYAIFAAYFYATRFFYKLYRENAECLKSLKEAPCFEIGSELLKEVEKNDGVIEYAVISGTIKALSDPLRSQYDSTYLQGVIQEKVTKKCKWIPFFSYFARNLQHKLNYVPFALYNKTSGLLKNQMCVEVTEPLAAQRLILPKVHDEFVFRNMFVPHGTYSAATYGFLCSKRIKNLQAVEGILSEGITLTAVGKLIIEDGNLKIKHPVNGFKYFLTPLTKEALINKYDIYIFLSKALFIMMCPLTLAYFICASRHALLKIKKKIIMKWQEKRLEKERKLRIADKSNRFQNANMSRCIVCHYNMVEVLILECAHACLCYDCSKLIKDLCPFCRSPIVRKVLAILP